MVKKQPKEIEMTVEQGGENPKPAPLEQQREAKLDTKETPKVKEQPEGTPGPDSKKGNPFDALNLHVSEDDDAPVGSLSLKTVLGGDILTGTLRRQVWLIMLIVAFVTVYVASRYQCQQDMLDIDKLEDELVDAKYKALSSSSNLTEQCRESHVLKALKNNRDSLLKPSDQPPYIINIE